MTGHRGHVSKDHAQAPVVHMRWRDVMAEALAAPASRPGRAMLTALGTLLGVGMFVVALGLTASTNAVVNRDFNALISTEIDASAGEPAIGAAASPAALDRAQRLNGLVAIGPLLQPGGIVRVGAFPQRPDGDQASGGISVLAASPGALQVIGPALVRGRLYDAAQEQRKAHVALLGAAAAKILGLRDAPLPRWLSIDGSRFLIEGIIGHTRRHAEALLDAVIPYATGRSIPGLVGTATPTVVAETRLGYTDAVAGALPAALYPPEPAAVTAAGLPQPTALRSQISGSLTELFVALAVVVMLVGMVGITNSAVLSVIERTGEIGVRRALGARRGQIALQFLLENLTIGTLGGIVGDCLGIAALAAIALAKGWTPVLPLWVALVAPVAGSFTGLLAGAYPAWRAAVQDPVHALAH